MSATNYAELTAEAQRRFWRIHRRRESLPPQHRRAVEGVAHALRRGSMNRAIPERYLLYLDLSTPTPVAAIAVGDLDEATHVSWHLSGVGIRPDTAMWGTVREVGQVVLEQRRVGAERPAGIVWLGYTPPVFVEALFPDRARAAVPRFAADFLQLLTFRPDRPHISFEGHSYGAAVAAHVLEAIAQRDRHQRPSRAVVELSRLARDEQLVKAFIMIGSPGIPARFGRDPGRLGIGEDCVFDAVAPDDWIARFGRLVGRVLRNRSPFGRRLPVSALPELGLLPVTGHNSSHFVPGRSQTTYGYRDAGTRSLRNIALVTTGQEPV
ncbi:alpha/beta hydrolase [Zhihengliuella halotolerans]|uniref:alpha/beta hydrolase n=1 Tax=Zhihengliuella halotolerans TaxID=370736 RepID=UPI000C800F83|nr:alpha/beta hydrolase [Zhihengliuella halotolerans]